VAAKAVQTKSAIAELDHLKTTESDEPISVARASFQARHSAPKTRVNALMARTSG
jgi:hypothetical protein